MPAAPPIAFDGTVDIRGVVDHLNADSDRSAAIVTGSVVESCLKHALQRLMHPNRDIHKEIFRPSGPLGSFRYKIEMGYLLGVYSEKIRRDLIKFKDVRNAFAHRLDITNFSSELIASKCMAITSIDRHVLTPEALQKYGEDCIQGKIPPEERRARLISRPDRDEMAASPRGRYMLFAEFIAPFLAEMATGEFQEYPVLNKPIL